MAERHEMIRKWNDSFRPYRSFVREKLYVLLDLAFQIDSIHQPFQYFDLYLNMHCLRSTIISK